MRLRATIVAISVSACGSGDKKPPDAAAGVSLEAALDLTGVVGFAIGDAAPSNGCDTTTLYAIKDNGDAVATTLVDLNPGDPACADTNVETAKGVFVTPKYVIVSYDATSTAPIVGGASCSFAVITRADGKVTCAAAGDAPPTRASGRTDTLFVGSPPSTTGGLSRVDMTATPPAVTLVDNPATTGHRIDIFDANSTDDALIAGNFGVKVLKHDGSSTDVSGSPESCQWYDSATDAFFVGTPRLQTSKRPARLVIQKLDPAFAPTTVGEVTSTSSAPPECRPAIATASPIGWTNKPAPALVELSTPAAGACWHPTGSPFGACTDDASCDGQCQGGGTCLSGVCCFGGSHDGEDCTNGNADCVGACSKGGFVHTVTGLKSIVAAYGQGSTVFVQGTDSTDADTIIVVNTAASFTQQTVQIAGQYKLTAVALASDGQLMFAATRLADSAHVIARCDTSSCAALSGVAPAITSLVRF